MSRVLSVIPCHCFTHLFYVSNFYEFFDYLRVRVCCCCLITALYDDPAMIHLTMVIMLSSRKIIAWHNWYSSFFCIALGNEWSTIIAIVIQLT